MHRPTLAAAFILVLSLAGHASAATYYVSTTGNDANLGTLSAPFRTITKGASTARPGDVVSVRGGVYNEIVKASVQGTATARITLQSYPGEKAIIDGTGTAANTDLVQLGTAQYADFVGFEVRNSTRLGIAGWGAKNVRILNNTVTRAYRGGIYVGYSAFGSTYDITIDGNTVFNNVLMNETHNMTSGGWGQSISVQLVNRATITRNRVYANDGEGIVVLQTDNALVQGNEVSDSFSVGIYLDNAQYTTVDGNFVYSTGNSRYFRNGYPAAGIGTANETYSSGANPLTNLTITNNIVVDTKWGFYYGAYESGGGLKNTTISNNTFYKSAAAMLWLEADAHANNFIQNNIFFQSGGGVMLSGTAAGTTFRANNWYGGNAGAAAGVGDILANPALVNPGGRTAADYKLTSASPVIDASASLASITTDFWNGARAGTHDIGAHEFGVAATPTLPPTAPTSVAASATTSSSIVLTWTASADASRVTGYKIFRNGVHVATVTGTTWTDSGLAPSTTYSYWLTAVDDAGNESPASTTASATTPAIADTLAPTMPSNFIATASTTTAAVQLTWSASSDDVGVTAYKVYRNAVLVATVATTSWNDSGSLACATTYQYAVAAVDAAGNVSAQNNATATTMADPVVADTQAPSAPTNFWITPSTSAARLYLSWNASSDNVGVAAYRVARNGVLVATVNTTTFTDESGLAWATTYQYAVTAVDAAGNVSPAVTGSATTIASPVSTDTQAPTVPGNFWVTPSNSSTRMYLSWHASTDNVGVAGYRIYRNGVLVATLPGTATTWTDDNNLPRRTTYTWAIAAFDAAGNVSASATFKATTKK